MSQHNGNQDGGPAFRSAPRGGRSASAPPLADVIPLTQGPMFKSASSVAGPTPRTSDPFAACSPCLVPPPLPLHPASSHPLPAQFAFMSLPAKPAVLPLCPAAAPRVVVDVPPPLVSDPMGCQPLPHFADKRHCLAVPAGADAVLHRLPALLRAAHGEVQVQPTRAGVFKLVGDAAAGGGVARFFVWVHRHPDTPPHTPRAVVEFQHMHGDRRCFHDFFVNATSQCREEFPGAEAMGRGEGPSRTAAAAPLRQETYVHKTLLQDVAAGLADEQQSVGESLAVLCRAVDARVTGATLAKANAQAVVAEEGLVALVAAKLLVPGEPLQLQRNALRLLVACWRLAAAEARQGEWQAVVARLPRLLEDASHIVALHALRLLHAVVAEGPRRRAVAGVGEAAAKLRAWAVSSACCRVHEYAARDVVVTEGMVADLRRLVEC